MISTVPNNQIHSPVEAALRVVLIEDLRDIREGLTALINGTAGFKCVDSGDEYRCVDDAFRLFSSTAQP